MTTARSIAAACLQRARAVAGRLARYRLTWIFLVFSAAIFVASAFTISQIAERSAENNILSLIQDESTRDAVMVAGVVQRSISGTQGASTVTPEEAGQQLSEFLDASNIFRLALYDPAGNRLWASNTRDWNVSADQRQLFADASGGMISSGLLRQQEVQGSNSAAATLDVVETYIPFTAAGTRTTVLILGISRDVTATFRSNMGHIEATMFRSILATEGAGFVVLLLFVLAADVTLSRSRARELTQERDLAAQRLAIRQLDIENRELERSGAERARFVSMVSHELKTPLTSVVAFTDILLKSGPQKDPERTGKFLQIIRKNGAYLQEMVSDLLDLARFQTGSLPIDRADFSLMNMLADVRDSMAVIFEARKQTVRLNIRAGASFVHGDRTRLTQVMRNLLSNASKYSPPQSVIEVDAALVDEGLAVTVTDHGVGMSQKDLSRLFTPFFRADNPTTRAASGTGLGLVIVKAIVEAHGGVVSVESEVGSGTRVSFRIPARPVPSERRAETRDQETRGRTMTLDAEASIIEQPAGRPDVDAMLRSALNDPANRDQPPGEDPLAGGTR